MKKYTGENGNPEIDAIIKTIANITGMGPDIVAGKYLSYFLFALAQFEEEGDTEEPKADTLARCKLRLAEARALQLTMATAKNPTPLVKGITRLETEISELERAIGLSME